MEHPSSELRSIPSTSATASDSAALDRLRTWCADGGISTVPSLVVVAHPDDETIGLGARLPRLPAATLVYLTDGAPLDPSLADPRNDPPRLRHQDHRAHELAEALRVGGVDAARLFALGAVDQQAARSMAAAATRIASLVLATRAQVLFTHPYEGGHPDHDAAAFAVHAAAELLRAGGHGRPAIIEMAYYHAACGTFTAGDFVPGVATPVWTAQLSEDERLLKERLFACHATQHRALTPFPRTHERFRFAPAYDFLRAPHDGELHYERLGWPMTGSEWRTLAASALQALGLRRPPWR